MAEGADCLHARLNIFRLRRRQRWRWSDAIPTAGNLVVGLTGVSPLRLLFDRVQIAEVLAENVAVNLLDVANPAGCGAARLAFGACEVALATALIMSEPQAAMRRTTTHA